MSRLKECVYPDFLPGRTGYGLRTGPGLRFFNDLITATITARYGCATAALEYPVQVAAYGSFPVKAFVPAIHDAPSSLLFFVFFLI